MSVEVGKYYKHLSERIEFLGHRGDKYIFCFRNGDTVSFRKESVDVLVTPWEEEEPPVVIEGYFNIYHSDWPRHKNKKEALESASADRIDCLHIRYDSSKPLKERIQVIEEEQPHER